jgi:hypothetical protein
VSRVVTLVALAALGAASAAAQTSVRARLEGRVPAAVVATVDSLVSAAVARDLPTEPLIHKALEGGAKGVPADRILVAVRLVATRLSTAASALDRAGAERSAAAIEAGAFALTAGLSGEDVSALVRGARNEPTPVLRVAATLSALGVPAAETVALVTSTTAAGGDVTALPQTVQASITRGATPAQAARLAQGGGGRGQPHGPPPDRPSRPHPNKP